MFTEEFYMDAYCVPHNRFYLNENVLKKQSLWWLRQTRKSVGDTPIREGSDQLGKGEQDQASRPRITDSSDWCMVAHKHFLTLVNGDNVVQRVTGQLQCKPLTTLEKIALERYRSTVFNFKRCHEKSHKLLLLTICTICPWWNVCVPTLHHFT